MKKLKFTAFVLVAAEISKDLVSLFLDLLLCFSESRKHSSSSLPSMGTGQEVRKGSVWITAVVFIVSMTK
ncbi:MAG: hypothetical protein M1426_02830 [Patescibacteria group bacterium]|nr:hypothetical protein [Patescibacteria group bacterium]